MEERVRKHFHVSRVAKRHERLLCFIGRIDVSDWYYSERDLPPWGEYLSSVRSNSLEAGPIWTF